MDGGKKKYKKRQGVPYWCINSKGVIENKNYIFNDDTNEKNFAELLVREQILILQENE